MVKVAETAAHASETFRPVEKNAGFAGVAPLAVQQTAQRQGRACGGVARHYALNKAFVDGVKDAPVEAFGLGGRLGVALTNLKSQGDEIRKLALVLGRLSGRPVTSDSGKQPVHVASTLALQSAFLCSEQSGVLNILRLSREAAFRRGRKPGKTSFSPSLVHTE